jgi:hypothetical protein
MRRAVLRHLLVFSIAIADVSLEGGIFEPRMPLDLVDGSALFFSLQLLSNVAYLLPALRTYRLRAYRFMTWLLAVAIASTFHHFCFDGHLCEGKVGLVSQEVDITLALYVGALSFLFTVAYDPVKVNIERVLPETETRLRVHYYHYQDHTYSQVMEVVFLLVTLYLVLFFGNSWLTIGLLLGLLAALIFLNVALYWRLKAKTWRQRYNFFKLGIGLALAVLATVLFVGQAIWGRIFHPIWHILTALSADFLIAGASGHIEDHVDGVLSVDLNMR